MLFFKQIGNNIDFLILDTAHALPGEFFDFIVRFSFLKEGCIAVMHDTIENYLTYRDGGIATELLLDTVKTSDKYYMWENEVNIASLSNIAAFKIKRETKDNVRDLFSVMAGS